MGILERHIKFVKGQAQYHDRKAEELKADTSSVIFRKHLASAGRFRALAEDLEAAERKLNEAEVILKPVKLLRSINLMPDELEGLPLGLLDELVSESDKIDREIYKIIEECGGMASLDRIILSLYKRTGEIHKRQPTTSRLYRMSQKGFAFPVPGKKGVYSIKQMSESEVNQLFNEAPAISISVSNADPGS